MTHGHLSYLPTSRLRDLLDPDKNPTFKKEQEAFAHQIILMKVRALAFHLGRTFRTAVKNTVFPGSIQVLREELDWVSEAAFWEFTQAYYKPYWMRSHPLSIRNSGYNNLKKVVKEAFADVYRQYPVS
eukprot:gene29176-36282_t